MPQLPNAGGAVGMKAVTPADVLGVLHEHGPCSAARIRTKLDTVGRKIKLDDVVAVCHDLEARGVLEAEWVPLDRWSRRAYVGLRRHYRAYRLAGADQEENHG